MTITEFLLARIAEDEAVARDWRHLSLTGHDKVSIYGGGDGYFQLVNPARVLAECAAKRAIIEELFAYEQAEDTDRGDCCSTDELKAGLCRYVKPEAIRGLQILATVYADHPDYRQEWAL